MHSFESIVDALWLSLKARHDKRLIDPAGRRAIKAGYARPRAFPRRYGSLTLEKGEFREWLLAQSVDGRGAIWRCAYEGNPIVPKGKTQADTMTIDHIVPLAKGGETKLSNLQVISREQNLFKHDNSHGYFCALKRLLSTWPSDERHSVVKRLVGYRPNFGDRKKKAVKGRGW